MVSGTDPGPSSLLELLGTMVKGIPVLLLAAARAASSGAPARRGARLQRAVGGKLC